MKCCICGKSANMFLELVMHRMRIPLCGLECNKRMISSYQNKYESSAPQPLSDEERKALFETDNYAAWEDSWLQRSLSIKK